MVTGISVPDWTTDGAVTLDVLSGRPKHNKDTPVSLLPVELKTLIVNCSEKLEVKTTTWKIELGE